jgi:hypothetical protein
MAVLQNGFAAAPVDEAGRTSLARGGLEAPGQKSAEESEERASDKNEINGFCRDLMGCHWLCQ